MLERILNNELIMGIFFIIMFVGVLPLIIIWYAKELLEDLYKGDK